MQTPKHEATKPTVWREWGLNQLPQALRDCQTWEKDALRHGIGSVSLWFNPHGRWVVLVSQDLIDIELPF